MMKACMGEGESMGKVPEVGRVQDTTKELKRKPEGLGHREWWKSLSFFFFLIFIYLFGCTGY